MTPEQSMDFDLGALYAALDAQRLYSELDARRAERGLTWKQVAAEIGGFTAAMLTCLSQGGRLGFPYVLRLTRWLGRPAASFTRASDQ